MGRGTSINKAKRTYSQERNRNISNRTYVTKRVETNADTNTDAEAKTKVDTNTAIAANTESNNIVDAEGKKESAQKTKIIIEINGKAMFNSSGYVSITRKPETRFGISARQSFYRMINTYESEKNILLIEVSKTDLLLQLLDYIEKEETILFVKDDSKQFLPSSFQVPAILKLYLYKLFYPRIFDYSVTQDQSDIIFRSWYIKENFDQIYHQIELLASRIIYDGLLIATRNVCYHHIKGFHSYVGGISPFEEIEDLLCFIDAEFDKCKDERKKLLHIFAPSAIFMAKFLKNMYTPGETNKNTLENNQEKQQNGFPEDTKEKRITTLLQTHTFYAGHRSHNSLKALKETIKECRSLLMNDENPFHHLLNLYHINKKSHIFDLILMEESLDFKPYLLSGIITKFHINKMIENNQKNLIQGSNSKFALSSVHNDPNCIAFNLSSRDYEIIDSLIIAAARSFQLYYFTERQREVPSSIINDIISCNELLPYAKEVNQIIKWPKDSELEMQNYNTILSLVSKYQKEES